MKRKAIRNLGIIFSFIFITSVSVLAEDQVIQGGILPQVQGEEELQWIWGEVSSVDLENKVFVVKYLDYETDQEKEIIVNTDERTAYENIKFLEEMKPSDTLSVDYIVASDGKNIAKNVSIEKPEVMPVSTQRAEAASENTPAQNQAPAPVSIPEAEQP